MDNLEEYYMNVGRTLSKLSKLRFANIPDISIHKRTYLNTWPLYYDNQNVNVIDYVKEMGVIPRKTPYALAFELTYDDYKKCEKIEGSERLRARVSVMRSYIEVRRVECFKNKDVEIEIAYDPNETAIDELPTNTNHKRSLKRLKNKSDILIGFKSSSGNWQAKVDGFSGCYILNSLKLFPNQRISLVNRVEFSSSKLKGEKANRFVTNNPNHFKKILDITERNIIKTSKVAGWHKDFQKKCIKHEKEKHELKSNN